MQRTGYTGVDQNPHRTIHHSVCMVQSVLTNNTGRGGNAQFPVVTPISFRDLTIIYTYADGARCAVPLYDQSHTRCTEVDPVLFYLRSGAFPIRHPDHGYLMRIVLRGYFGRTVLDTRRADSEGAITAHVEADFELRVTGPSTDSFVTLYAKDRSGNRFPVGTLSMVEASLDVRRPSGLVLAR
jgi:hypothetical protein